MIETEDESRQKRPPPPPTTTSKKRTMDVSESTVRNCRERGFRKKIIFDEKQIIETQKRGRSSGQTTSGTSDFYSVGSESESSYQTAGENDDFKPKFLKKLNDTLATGLSSSINSPRHFLRVFCRRRLRHIRNNCYQYNTRSWNMVQK